MDHQNRETFSAASILNEFGYLSQFAMARLVGSEGAKVHIAGQGKLH